MIDMIGAITATAVYAVLVGVLVGFSPAGGPTKRAVFAAAGAWGGPIVAVAALGGFAPGATGPVPAALFAFAGLLVLLFGGWFLFPRFRSALLSVPLPALVGLNAGRLGGVFFLILAADGRLSAPFAPVAGGGDIVVGALAIARAAPGDRGRAGPAEAIGKPAPAPSSRPRIRMALTPVTRWTSPPGDLLQLDLRPPRGIFGVHVLHRSTMRSLAFQVFSPRAD